MIKSLILDLDGTLINTVALEPLRSAGRWREISKHFDQCFIYSGVIGVLNTARAAGIKVAVFTNSPSHYATGLLNYFDLTVDFLVAYHDVKHHKPSNEGVQKILDHFGIGSDEAIYLGDSDLDKEAAQNAKVKFYAVNWGSVSTTDKPQLGVSDLSEYIGREIGARDLGNYRSGIQQTGNRFYLGYYLDGIKEEVWSFKDGNEGAIKRWTDKTIELATSLPEIDIVIRALGHAELESAASSSQKPLNYLALNLARGLGAMYQPDALQKSRILKKSFQCSAAERREQVLGAYSVNMDIIGAESFVNLTFLVVDDVCTTGATTDEITRALSESYPNASIYVFTLVKTLYRSALDKASSKTQHNSLLYSNLYNPASITEEADLEERSNLHRGKQERSVSKNFTANYSNTNHNFKIHNLRSYSIASEPRSRPLYTALQIAKNILQRGKPTVASRELRAAFEMELADIGIDTPSQALISQLPVKWKRLIRGDETTGNYPARRFFDELVPKYFGAYSFIKQLIVPELQISDMTQVYVDEFQNRQVDFFIPQVGLIVEIDGSQHRQVEDVDSKRDAFTDSLGLKTVRFTTQEIASENRGFLQKIDKILDHIKRIDNLERDGVLKPPNGISVRDYQHAYQKGVDPADSRIRLTAAMRYQLLLIELLECGTLRLGEPQKLLLVNRDHIEFAGDALADLNEMLSNLLNLIGVSHLGLNIEIEECSELPVDRTGEDLVVDFSIFERYDDSFQINQDVVYTRTHYLDFYRYFSARDAISIEASSLEDYDFFELSCADPIAYDLDLSPDSNQRESLRYFLSNLFLPTLGDVDFREGQVGIIGSALSRVGTIGLLPTGSGKSICYQLSAVLQPAISFVVCPIKSLMYDQKFDLDSIGFSRSNYITSDLKADQKAKVQRDFGRGKYFFVFISPERFQTHGFRQNMIAIGLDHAFAYAVIDEAHCLSEWGHDFRTSYLNLSNTISKFAPAASYIGLTATASVNVLKDIQAEFDIPDRNVRTPLEFTRKELSFHVIDDGGGKVDAALQLVAEMDAKWNGSSELDGKAGIVFTPTVNGDKGCYDLAGRLASALNIDVRFFSGSAPKWGKMQGVAFDVYKRKVQEDFKLNKYRLLTATKAFGMGVNKGNVAYTVHFGIPGSMEALYQEAGRAGRDKELFQDGPADCYVLLTKEKNHVLLDKIWDSSTTVADLKSNAKRLSRESDINTNLFLMTNSLDTINDDFKLIAKIYTYLKKSVGRKLITLTAGQFGTNKSRFEKAIYRLSQLGIVSDWVIEDFFNGKLQIEFECLGEDQLVENIELTIGKYEPKFELKDVFNNDGEYYQYICERLDKGFIDKTEFVFLSLLLWSYDHFVYNRRQSLKTVYDQCSELASGKIAEGEFKDRLEAYFKFNESSHMLNHLAEGSADTSVWLSVFFEDSGNGEDLEIISKAGLVTLKEQLSRFLESYKSNICLNYLSGVVRLASDQFDDADGERRMASSIDSLLARDVEATEVLIKETLRLKLLFSRAAQSRFSKLVHEKIPDRALLEIINVEFEDPYSSRQLLAPMTTRLKNLIKRYEGIQW